MDRGNGNPLFRLADDGQVIVSLSGREQALGPRDDVCSVMEAFLIEIPHRFEPRFGGFTLDEWDLKWTPEGPLVQDFGRLSPQVGLYKAFLGESLMYIGKATEYANGGFRKRLHDYYRDSDSARKSKAGKKIFEHRAELTIEIIVTGTDRAGSQIATCLEDLFIERYNPSWNNFGRSKRSALA